MRPRLRIIHKQENGIIVYAFKCPACNEEHHFNSTWQFDGNFEMPTISPSILVTYPYAGKPDEKCHSWITAGKIKFFDDCTHYFIKNVEVDLPEYGPEELL